MPRLSCLERPAVQLSSASVQLAGVREHGLCFAFASPYSPNPPLARYHYSGAAKVEAVGQISQGHC